MDDTWPFMVAAWVAMTWIAIALVAMAWVAMPWVAMAWVAEIWVTWSAMVAASPCMIAAWISWDCFFLGR